jgi:hypothetical protein
MEISVRGYLPVIRLPLQTTSASLEDIDPPSVLSECDVFVAAPFSPDPDGQREYIDERLEAKDFVVTHATGEVPGGDMNRYIYDELLRRAELFVGPSRVAGRCGLRVIEHPPVRNENNLWLYRLTGRVVRCR